MAGYLLALLGFFGTAALIVGGAVSILFRHEIKAAYDDFKSTGISIPNLAMALNKQQVEDYLQLEIQAIAKIYEEPYFNKIRLQAHPLTSWRVDLEEIMVPSIIAGVALNQIRRREIPRVFPGDENLFRQSNSIRGKRAGVESYSGALA